MFYMTLRCNRMYVQVSEIINLELVLKINELIVECKDRREIF